MTKTEFAFRLSCQKFLEDFPPGYFWMFSFTKAMPDWYYAGAWGKFTKELGDLYGGTLRGVRVMELHEQHGVHYHALLNYRIWVGEVRRIGERYGIGRVHVQKVYDDAGAIEYLAKYVSKQFGAEKLHSRCARWGTVGGFRGVPVKDIVIESNFTRALQELQRQTGIKKWSLPVINALRRETELHGLERSKWFGVAGGLINQDRDKLRREPGLFSQIITLGEQAQWEEENCPF
jgi:hypothetical protein